MGEELISKLRAALLDHHVRLEPVPRELQYSHDPNDPTLSYISSMLLDDDDDGQEQELIPIQFQDSYQSLLTELTDIISSPCSSSHEENGTPGSSNHEENSTEITSEEIQEGDSSAAALQALLMQCAQAVAANNGSEFYRIVRQVKSLASNRSTAAQRAALYFADALVARFTGFGPQVYRAMMKGLAEKKSVHVRVLNLPCHRASQRFANQTILDLCAERKVKRLHIVDYGISHGCQWPALIQRLPLQPGGAPKLKITGIDFPHVDVKQTGRSLMDFARQSGVSLEFDAVESSAWETVQPTGMMDEFLVVNCNLRLRHLREDGSVVDNPRKLFFDKIYKLRPAAFIMCVLNANANMSSPFFLQRFQESLNNFFMKMEFFEALLQSKVEEHTFMENILAKAIMNVVACEGIERAERPASYKSWDSRARKAGFEQVPFSESTLQRVLEAWNGYEHNENFRRGIDENWLLLGWKDFIIYGMSIWQPKSLKRYGL